MRFVFLFREEKVRLGPLPFQNFISGPGPNFEKLPFLLSREKYQPMCHSPHFEVNIAYFRDDCYLEYNASVASKIRKINFLKISGFILSI